VTEQIYEDMWGEVFDRPSSDLTELRWFDTTADMSTSDFQAWLTKFAECVEKTGRSRVLVDSTAFRMSPAKMDGPWRDVNIIPRYNAAGVKKFAFHMPDGMPLIGQPPENEAPGKFPTGYFGTRRDALAWLEV